MNVHPSLADIGRYTAGDTGLDEATIWAMEAHLEDCEDCRARLAGSTSDESRAVIDRVAVNLAHEIVAGSAPARHARPWSALSSRWLAGTLLPWVLMTAAVLASAVALSRLWPGMPSLVLLLAPLAPLPGVAVAWNRRTDPAWELIAGTPGAGLAMLLRRTLAVLALVIPTLAAAGVGAGVSLALMLVPGLALTAAALLLGMLVGVRNATIGLITAWTLAVIAPSLADARLPVLLEPASVGAWGLVTGLLVALAALRADGFRRLAERD